MIACSCNIGRGGHEKAQMSLSRSSSCSLLIYVVHVIYKSVTGFTLLNYNNRITPEPQPTVTPLTLL